MLGVQSGDIYGKLFIPTSTKDAGILFDLQKMLNGQNIEMVCQRHNL